MDALIYDGQKAVNLADITPGTDLYNALANPGGATTALYATQGYLYRCIEFRAAAVANSPFRIERIANGEVVYKSADDRLPPELAFLRDATHNPRGATMPRGGLKYKLYETELALSVSPNGAFWYKLKRRGRVANTRWLLPTSITPCIDPVAGLTHFERATTYRDVPIKLHLDDVLFFRRPSISDELLSGTPPAAAACLDAGVLLNYSQFAQMFFERGAIKATLLTYEGGSISRAEKERLRSWWNNLIAGIKNAFTTEILNARVNPVVIGEGIKELSNNALSNEKREAIAAALGIPYSLVSSNAANFATKQQDTQDFYTFTIAPECNLIIAPTINDQLLNPLGYHLIFDHQQLAIFQADETKRAGALNSFVTALVTAQSNNIDPEGVLAVFGYDIPPDVNLFVEPRENPFNGGAATSPPPISPATAAEPAGVAPESAETAPPTNAPTPAEIKALANWKKKALKARRAGKSPAVKFESAEIDPIKFDAINAALQCGCAHHEPTLKAIFDNPPVKADDPETPETSPLTALFADIERRFARQWNKARRAQFEALETLGSADAILAALVSADFLRQWGDQLMPAVVALLEGAAEITVRAEAGKLAGEMALSVDWTMTNQRAADWARDHAGKLIRRKSNLFKQTIVETDIDRIRTQIANWIEAGEAMPALTRRLQKIVTDPGRADVIAATETTRTYAHAALEVWHEAGLISAELMQQAETHLPVHVRCRCWLAVDPDRGIIHQTARDELVCPFCRPLQGKIIAPISAENPQ